MAQRYRRRRRRRLNPRFLVLVGGMAALLIFLICLIVSCAGSDRDTEQDTSGVTTEPVSAYGWQEEDGKRWYKNQNGTRATGWLEVGGKRYFLDADGFVTTGWHEDNGVNYYLTEDGSMATGTVTIDGRDHHFTSAGVPILVANPWNSIPEGYSPDLVALSIDVSVEGSQVDRSCFRALMDMINDCNKACPKVCVVSSYRTNEYQTNSYNNKVQSYIAKGYTQADAEKEAATIIALPGTSEHQLGLAVDIIDTRLWALEEEQANLPAQQWLMENCWKYGFILRYPKGKIDETGIIYEPWHYRYVGQDVAKELHESGMTLEKYLESLS